MSQTSELGYIESSAGPVSTKTGAAIQRQIDALPPTGGVVYLEAGTYRVTATMLVSKPSVYLRGQGSGVTKLLGTGDFTVLRFDSGEVNTPIFFGGVFDLDIESAGAALTDATGLELIAPNGVMIKACSFYSCNHNIKIERSNYTLLESLTSFGQGPQVSNIGVLIGELESGGNPFNRVVFKDCIFALTAVGAVRAYNPSSSSFSKCQFIFNTGYAIHIGAPPTSNAGILDVFVSDCLVQGSGTESVIVEKGLASSLNNVVVKGCSFTFCTGTNIRLDGVTNPAVQSCTSNQASNGVVELKNCSDGTVTDCVIGTWNGSNSGASAVKLVDSTGVVVSGCVIRNPANGAPKCLETTGTSDYTVVTGNALTAVTAFAGANNVIANNATF